MKSTYRNALRSKELIREALVKLLAKEDIASITVSDIVRTANINRGTFYNHYNNIMEVAEEMESDLFDGVISLLKNNPPQHDVTGVMKTLIKHFKENEDGYRALLKGISKPAMDALVVKFVTQIHATFPNVDTIMLLFIVNGMTGTYFDYLEGKINKPLDEIGDQCIEIINKIIK